MITFDRFPRGVDHVDDYVLASAVRRVQCFSIWTCCVRWAVSDLCHNSTFLHSCFLVLHYLRLAKAFGSASNTPEGINLWVGGARSVVVVSSMGKWRLVFNVKCFQVLKRNYAQNFWLVCSLHKRNLTDMVEILAVIFVTSRSTGVFKFPSGSPHSVAGLEGEGLCDVKHRLEAKRLHSARLCTCFVVGSVTLRCKQFQNLALF